MLLNQRAEQRKRVAREAAELLYTELEKEFKQAKFRAAENLGIHSLPSNAEIAEELDRIAKEREGDSRQEKLLQRRLQALQIMQILKDFHPALIGSVWRGTAHRRSDIDIVVFGEHPQQIVSELRKKSYFITKTKAQTITKEGKKRESFHIHIDVPPNDQVEIVVRGSSDLNSSVKCEIYGDRVTGLTIQQLQKVLKENPTQKFAPK